MANLSDVKNEPVKITLSDGVERELRFTLNAMAELEDRYGTVEAAFEKLEQNSIKALRLILWAGLVSDDPDLTEQQVGDLIDIQNMTALVETMGGAFKKDMPDAPEDAEAETDPNVLDPA